MEIGCDLVVVNELDPILARDRLLQLVFTPEELALAAGVTGSRRREFLAGRFCAKEAVAKLLGTGFLRGVWWRDIEVGRSRCGRPHIVLHRGACLAARRRAIGPISVTVTHKSCLVIAVAIAPRRGGARRRGKVRVFERSEAIA